MLSRALLLLALSCSANARRIGMRGRNFAPSAAAAKVTYTVMLNQRTRAARKRHRPVLAPLVLHFPVDVEPAARDARTRLDQTARAPEEAERTRLDQPALAPEEPTVPVDAEAAAKAAWLAKRNAPSWGKRQPVTQHSSLPEIQSPSEATRLSVRKMEPGDLQQVTDLKTAVFAPHLKRGVDLYLQARAWEEAMANKTATIVACATGRFAHEFAGRAQLDARSEPILGTADLQMLAAAHAAYVVNVCTHPLARRRGVARQMMEQIEQSATEMGARALALHVDAANAPALALYESLGFVRDGQAHVHAAVAEFEGEDEPPRTVLVKPLVQSAAPPQPRPLPAAVSGPAHAVARFPAFAALGMSHCVVPGEWI